MAQKQQATTRVNIRNDTGTGKVKFQEKNDWSGTVRGHYPETIKDNHTGKFLHEGIPPEAENGSEGGIIYVGPNVQGQPDNSAWVFAWSVPGDGSPNKVYVESGPKGRFPPDAVNWDKIKTKLKDSTHTSHYFDDNTKAEISANIEPKGNTPALQVAFDVSF